MDLSSSPLRANLELKARLPDHEGALRTCSLLEAEEVGLEKQVDTYFSMGRYRLKLRQSSTGKNWLIGYSRPDEEGVRKSQYRLVQVVAPRSVKRTLSTQWGVKAVVTKERRVFLWRKHVRIHVDRVDGLGTFIEFEAVLDDDDLTYDEGCAQLDVARLQHDFGIRREDRIDTSYGTLVRDAARAAAG